jgi:hypothetical protein
MTVREWAATKRYERLTKEERENLAKIGIKGLKTRFCSSLQRDLLQGNDRIKGGEY